METTASETLRPEAIALGVFGGIAGAAALLIAGQIISRRIRFRGDGPRRRPGPWRRSAHDRLRQPHRHPRGRPRRLPPGRAGGPRAVPAGPARAGAAVPAPSRCTPTGRSSASVWRVSWLALGAIAVAASVVSLPDRAARPRPAGVALVGVDRRHPGRDAAVSRDRRALRPRAGRRTDRGSRAVCHPGRHPGRHRRGGHRDLRVQPRHPASPTRRCTAGTGRTTSTGEAGSATSRARRRRSCSRGPARRAAGAGVYYSTLQIDGVNVPVMGSTTRAAVAPPSSAVTASTPRNQVVLGAATLRQLHKQVGDTVDGAGAQRPARVRLTIVGTATLPPIGVDRLVAPRDGYRRRALLPADPAGRPGTSSR